MNTGFLGFAVATVLTVYGIETRCLSLQLNLQDHQLQQYLPFTVLKLNDDTNAIVPGVTGCNSTYRLRY